MCLHARSLGDLNKFVLLVELILDNNQLDHTMELQPLVHLKTLSVNNNNIIDLHAFVKRVKLHCTELTFLRCVAVPLAWCPCLSSSEAHALCMDKVGLDLLIYIDVVSSELTFLRLEIIEMTAR